MTQSVVRGDPIALEVFFRDISNNLADATTPLVSVVDPNGLTVINASTPTHISLGLYEYVYSSLITDPVGTWDALWTGTVGSQAVRLDSTFIVLPGAIVQPAYSGTYSYDPASTVGRVRMLIDDRDVSSTSGTLPLEQRSAIFSDEEIGMFLSQTLSDVMYASALALITISGNRQLLIQSRRIGRTTVDYGIVRKSLQAQAMALIQMSNMQPADALAEMTWTDPSFRQILVNAQLRMMT